jgi:RNA polymerase-binding transcription factor DksA
MNDYSSEAALLDQLTADLEGIDAALRRVDEGTYGTCEVCGAPIADDVLAADPLAVRCAGH